MAFPPIIALAIVPRPAALSKPHPRTPPWATRHSINPRHHNRFNFIESSPPILDNFSDIVAAMSDFWSNWAEAVRFSCEEQNVISARLILFASGAPNAADEASRMIAEKVAAFTEAGIAAERALAGALGLFAAAEHAYAPRKRCVP